MYRKLALTLLATLTNTTFAAATFPGTALLASKSVRIPRGGAVVALATRDANTALLRVGMRCERRGASIREIGAGGVSWKGRNTGAWNTTNAVAFREVRMQIVPTGIGSRDAECTLWLYDGSDKSYENDALPTGTINFPNVNSQNQLMIRECLNQQFAKALADHGVPDATAKVWLPPQQSSSDARQLLFNVGATEGSFGGQSYGFTLVLLAGERWAYSSFGGGIGPITVNSWSYQAKSMSRVGYALANDGSGQPLFRVDAGACWAN